VLEQLAQLSPRLSLRRAQGRLLDDRVQQLVDPVARVEHKDVTKVGLRGPHQVEPVHLGAGMGALVGQDDTLVKPG
jgi:hypothetical protein